MSVTGLFRLGYRAHIGGANGVVNAAFGGPWGRNCTDMGADMYNLICGVGSKLG